MNSFFQMLKKMCSSVCCTPLGSVALTLAILAALAIGTGPRVLEAQIVKAFKNNPTLLADAVRENPFEFMTAVRDAAKSAQEEEGKKREEQDQRALQEKFESPLRPLIRKDENIRGNVDAPITLVEYSDFECPFCSRAFATVQELRKKYGSKLRFIYKHLPLSFHPNAMDAALYHEAIRLQSGEKAWEFHDELLENISKVKKGRAYFKSLAKRLGMNMKKLGRDVDSKKVKQRVGEDMKEAEKFGFRGTPGFVINGIPVKGAYPPAHFYQIVDQLKEKGKLNI